MITDSQLKEWEALCEAATPGPWSFHHRCSGYPKTPAPNIDEVVGLGWDWTDDEPFNVPPEPMRGIFARGADAAFVAASREALPLLIAEVRRLREKS